MRFNFDKFSDSLIQNKSKKELNQKGLYNVIRSVWNLRDIDEIDFDSFSYKDVKKAFEIFEEAPFHYNETTDTLLLNPANPFVKYYETEGTVLNLFKVERMYNQNEDDDFI